MKFHIEIDTANDAFADEPIEEIERIVRGVPWEELAGHGPFELALSDANGNSCGSLELVDSPADEPDGLSAPEILSAADGTALGVIADLRLLASSLHLPKALILQKAIADLKFIDEMLSAVIGDAGGPDDRYGLGTIRQSFETGQPPVVVSDNEKGAA